MIYGYARISLFDQNLDRQLKDLEVFGCEKIYYDKEFRKESFRPVYRELRSKIQCGDVFVIHNLNGFGRNKREILNEWKQIINDGIDIVVLNMPILDTRKYKEMEGVGPLVFNLVSTMLLWMMEEERNQIRIAQLEGIARAKEKGVFKGGKKRFHKDAKGKDKIVYDEVVRLLKEKETVMNIHRQTGCSRNTIYSIKRELAVDCLGGK